MCQDHRELYFSQTLIKVRNSKWCTPLLFSKRAIADMLFKSLAALIRSHSTLLTEQGLIIPRQDAPVLAELFFQLKVES